MSDLIWYQGIIKVPGYTLLVLTMSIKVELKLFAMLKELVGKARLEMEIPAKAGVEDLFQSLANQYPAVAELRDHLLIVRDREYLRAEDELTEGDVLSLYPPLSGG